MNVSFANLYADKHITLPQSHSQGHYVIQMKQLLIIKRKLQRIEHHLFHLVF